MRFTFLRVVGTDFDFMMFLKNVNSESLKPFFRTALPLKVV